MSGEIKPVRKSVIIKLEYEWDIEHLQCFFFTIYTNNICVKLPKPSDERTQHIPKFNTHTKRRQSFGSGRCSVARAQAAVVRRKYDCATVRRANMGTFAH